MSRVVTLDHRVLVPEEVLFRELDGEAVILHLKEGIYFGLDEVATAMWYALAHQADLRAAFASLADRYDVDDGRLEADFLWFTGELIARKLLVPVCSDESHASV